MKLLTLFAAVLFLASQANAESLFGYLRGRALRILQDNNMTAEGAEGLEQGENDPMVQIDNFLLDTEAAEEIANATGVDFNESLYDEFEQVADEAYVSSQANEVNVTLGNATQTNVTRG